MNTEKRAVAVSFNWETRKILFQTFDGDGAAEKALAWISPESFVQKDFLASQGWAHFTHCNEAARDEDLVLLLKAFSKGTI